MTITTSPHVPQAGLPAGIAQGSTGIEIYNQPTKLGAAVNSKLAKVITGTDVEIQVSKDGSTWIGISTLSAGSDTQIIGGIGTHVRATGGTGGPSVLLYPTEARTTVGTKVATSLFLLPRDFKVAPNTGVGYSAEIRDQFGLPLTDATDPVTFSANIPGTWAISGPVTPINGVAQNTFTPTIAARPALISVSAVGLNGDTVNLTVNTAPVVAPMTEKVMAAGATDTIAISASDADGDAIEFLCQEYSYSEGELTDPPSWVSCTPDAQVGNTRTGVLNLTPPLGESGITTLQVTADDGLDSHFERVDVNVTSNARPILAPIGDVTHMTGSQLDVNLSATDPDGNNLTFSVINAPAWAELIQDAQVDDTRTGRVRLTAPPTVGVSQQTMTVRVTDDGPGNLYTEETFEIATTNNTVHQEVTGETVLYFSNYVSLVDYPPWLLSLVTDAGAASGYAVDFSGVSGTSVSPDAPYASFQVNFVTLGLHYFFVRTRSQSGDSMWVEVDGVDGGGSHNLNVLLENDTYQWDRGGNPPLNNIDITTTGQKEVRIYRRERSMHFDALVITTNPDWITLGATTPAPAESARVPSSGNTAPVFAPLDPQTMQEGDTRLVDGSAIDNQGNNISFTFAVDGGALPGWISAVDNTDGTFRWTFNPTVTPSTAGTYVCATTATDDGSPSLSATQNFTVTVTAQPGGSSLGLAWRALDAERADGFNGWAAPAEQIFSRTAYGKDARPDQQIRACWLNMMQSQYRVIRDNTRAFKGTHSWRYVNGKEATSGKGRCMHEMIGTIDDRTLAKGVDFWYRYVSWDDNSVALLRSVLGTSSTYFMHHQLHNNAAEQSGYGRTNNPMLAIVRSYHDNYGSYRVIYRSNEAGGVKNETPLVGIPFYQGVWQKFVWHVRLWNETSGGPDGVLKLWTAPAGQPLQQVINRTGIRFGYRYASAANNDRAGVYGGIYTNSGETIATPQVKTWMDTWSFYKDDPAASATALDPDNATEPFPLS